MTKVLRRVLRDMVLTVQNRVVSIADPALQGALAARAHAGRPRHGQWDCCDIPTEAQLQMQRHAAKMLERQQAELLREEAEAEAAEAARDKEVAEAEAAEAEAEREEAEAREAKEQALKERQDVELAREALAEAELELSVLALQLSRPAGANRLDAAEERVKQARKQLEIEIQEAEEAEATAARERAEAEAAAEVARKERQEAIEAQAIAEKERAEADAAAEKLGKQGQAFSKSVAMGGARPPPVKRPNLAKTKLKKAFQAMYRLTDIDGDGDVSMDECVELDSQVAEVTGQEFDPVATRRAWEEMDVDGDGEVSVHEYVTMQMKHVAPADYEKMVRAASFAQRAPHYSGLCC